MKRVLSRRSEGFALGDLLVVVVLIPLACAAFYECVTRVRYSSRGCSNRVKCASNLRQIGQAVLLYANDNKGAYPRTVWAGGAIVTPTWGTGASAPNPFKAGGPAPNDVTAALFLLLRTQDITPEVFTCPSSNAETWDFGGGSLTAENWSNWQGGDGIRKHLSYSFANPYPDEGAVKRGFVLSSSLNAEFVVASDMNPGAPDAECNIFMVTTTSSARCMQTANSANHDGDGQNVLYGDGHVEFQQTPFCGVNRDNIFVRRAGADGFLPAPGPIAQSPYDQNDSVLLPTD